MAGALGSMKQVGKALARSRTVTSQEAGPQADEAAATAADEEDWEDSMEDEQEEGASENRVSRKRELDTADIAETVRGLWVARDATTAKIAKSETTIESLVEEKERAQDELKEAKNELKEAKDELKEAKVEVKEAKDELKEAKAKVEAAEAKVEAAEAKVEAAEEDLVAAVNVIDGLSDDGRKALSTRLVVLARETSAASTAQARQPTINNEEELSVKLSDYPALRIPVDTLQSQYRLLSKAENAVNKAENAFNKAENAFNKAENAVNKAENAVKVALASPAIARIAALDERIARLDADKSLLLADKSSLLAEVVGITKAICKHTYFEGSFWEAITAILPHRDERRSSKSKTGVANFPFHPMRVREISHATLMQVFEKLGFLDQLKSVTVEERLARLLHVDGLKNDGGSSANEVGTLAFVMDDLWSVYGFCHRQRALGPNTRPWAVSGAEVPLVAKMDITVEERSVEGSEVGELVLVGEIKTKSYTQTNLGKQYCDHTCKAVKKEKGPKGKTGKAKAQEGEPCDKERHKDVSVLRQLYNYMVLSGVLYGLYSNHSNWAGFIRDCAGNLVITPCLTCDAEQPYTVPQFLVLFYMLARGQNLPPQLVEEAGGILVHCDDETKCTPSGSGAAKEPRAHTALPSECHAEPQEKRTGASGRSKRASFCIDGDGSQLSVQHLDFTSAVQRGRTGFARRASLGRHEAVVKIADVFKKPELEDELLHEAKVYERLAPLQGSAVPRLLAHGAFSEGIFFGLATEDCGESAESFEPDAAFRTRALEALREVHKYGVLHGDVKRGNVLRAPDGRAVIIDFGMAKLGDRAALWQEQERELAELDMALRSNRECD